MPLNSIEKKL
jgi:hypothetical protein